MVEVIRALAEESGSLGHIGKRSLPQQVLAGGIEQVLKRRLLRVPLEARPVLRLAAVAGRELDLNVLARSEPQLMDRIEQCADVGVLELHEQHWRFTHDKLRDRLQKELSATERRALHATVAQSLEEVYPGSLPHAPQLAYHHREAQQLARAAHYYALAGEAALQRGTAQESLTLLEQAQALRQGLAVSRLESVRVFRGLVLAHFSLGHLNETGQALQRLCELVGAPLPSDRLGLARALLRQAGEQVLRRTGLHKYLRPSAASEEQRALLPELMQALTAADLHIWLGQPAQSLLRTLWGLNLAEALSAGPLRAFFMASLAYFLSNLALHRLSVRYLRLAEADVVAGSANEVYYLRAASMMWINEGRWRDAAEVAARAVAGARAQRDDVALMYSLMQAQIVDAGQDEYRKMLEHSAEMEQLASKIQNARNLAYALCGQVLARLRLGEVAEADAALQRLRPEVVLDGAVVTKAVAHGVGALCAHRLGQRQRADAQAESALRAVRSSRWLIAQLRNPLTSALAVWLEADAPFTYLAHIREALAKLRRLAFRFPNARANYYLYRGRFEWLRGHQLRARVYLQRSLHTATSTGARYEQAEAHYWLGHFASSAAQEHDRRLPIGESAESHLQSALALFTQLEAQWDASRARAALAKQSS